MTKPVNTRVFTKKKKNPCSSSTLCRKTFMRSSKITAILSPRLFSPFIMCFLLFEPIVSPMAETRQQKPRDAATVPRIVRLPVAVVSRDPNKRSFGRSLVERACLGRCVWLVGARARGSVCGWVPPNSCVFVRWPSRRCWPGHFDSDIINAATCTRLPTRDQGRS